MGNEFNNVGKYLKKINDQFDKSKSLTEILESFSCISSGMKEYLPQETSYSNINYSLCTQEEQQEFENQQLQFIETLVINSIYEKTGIIWNWKDIFDLINNDIYSTVDKIRRKVVYATASSNRPIGDAAYMSWNGLQIIDLDIKNKEIAENLKPVLFKELQKYHWFLGICTSASQKSLHIWTKITPISISMDNRKIEFMCNFRHKYSYIYIVLSQYKEKYGYTKNSIFDYMDMAMAKPQQGIFITSDKNAMMSTNFQDLRLDVNFEQAYNTGVESINWIAHPDLKQVFHKLEWFNNDTFDKETNIELSEIDNINERVFNNSRQHYKHAQRWQLANTLTNIYGQNKALQIMLQICSGTDKRELMGDVKTASIHNKPISVWAINELNKNHGFNIKFKNDTFEERVEILEKALDADDATEDPVRVLTNETSKQKINLYMNRHQFLSDIKEDIFNNLSNITLLEAGAGYGKTEMIKALKGKTMLILPFTSTIKAKVEKSETTSDWLYYYGNKRVSDADLLSNKSMSMTIDKFSRINLMVLDQANFDYIVVDESHLLFTSSYREVMAPTIQRIANCKAKVILMTGTPTGEVLFFPSIQHIKVTKEDVRDKTFDVTLCHAKQDVDYNLAQDIAQDIIEGRKILFPTNNGSTYYEIMKGMINKALIDKNFDRELNAFYYKKSNFDDESMDEINFNKSIGSNDIVFCTTYLSVGVDICDKHDFRVYFNELMIAQDIEQFANRIRNNDLHIKLYLPMIGPNDENIEYNKSKHLNLNISNDELVIARDMVKTCNDVLERNNEDSKYNPLISSLLSGNKYLKYDENDCKYYIDETTFKLKFFEDRYSDYAKQLQVLQSNMRYYGYLTRQKSISEAIPDDKRNEVDQIFKSYKHLHYVEVTQKTKELLANINDGNIEKYKELLKGNYEIFKSDNYDTTQGDDGQIYKGNIEILEKNIPIIISLYKYYDCETINDIYEFCIDTKTNKINFSKLERVRRFANIQSSLKKNRLDFPIKKFIKDVMLWINDHSTTTPNERDNFLGNWTAKYCNSIKDLVVDDSEYFESIYEKIKELWSIIIIQTRPKNGNIVCTPFKLLWQTKQDMQSIYGDINTQRFFADELIDDVKDNFESGLEITEELPEFEHTEKKTLEQVMTELPNVIHEEFDYGIYSEKDESNKRFLIKQENNNPLRDTIFNIINKPVVQTTQAPDLFSGIELDGDVPF